MPGLPTLAIEENAASFLDVVLRTLKDEWRIAPFSSVEEARGGGRKRGGRGARSQDVGGDDRRAAGLELPRHHGHLYNARPRVPHLRARRLQAALPHDRGAKARRLRRSI